MRSVALLALLALGCDGAGAPDAAVEPDGGIDRDGGPVGLAVPRPDALPVSDGLRLGPGLDLDVASAIAVAPDGAVELVFDSFGGSFAGSELWTSASTDGRRFAAPRPTGFTRHPFEASPSFVRGVLYFAGADALSGAATLYRAGVGRADAVRAIESLLSWPRIYAWGDRVALVYRDAASRPMIAWGDDAASLGAPVVVSEGGAAMATLGVFADGSLAYAYQHPVGAEPMVSFVRRSSDGTAWSEPVRVTDAAGNVHDTTLVARADGGLDLYYVYPAPAGRFALFRRAMAADGRMGEEERVSADALGEPSKPEGARVADGRVLIAFADIAARGPSGEPSGQELVLVSLPSEAPPP